MEKHVQSILFVQLYLSSIKHRMLQYRQRTSVETYAGANTSTESL